MFILRRVFTEDRYNKGESSVRVIVLGDKAYNKYSIFRIKLMDER